MVVLIVAKAVFALSLKLLNIILHSVGILLLKWLLREGKGDEQMIYLVNLSTTELAINALSFVRNLLKTMPYPIFHSPAFKEIVDYSYIADYAILKYSMYMTMIIITLDRAFLIFLNVSYHVYWNMDKAKRYVISIWVSAFLLFIISSVVYDTSSVVTYQNKSIITTAADTMSLNNTTIYTTNMSEVIRIEKRKTNLFLVLNYATVAFDLLFLGIAVSSYCLIFHKYKQTRPDTKQGAWKVFRQSRFYVSALLISTFIVFVIPSDFIWVFYSLYHRNEVIELMTTISYAISYLSDGLIYIFMNDNVKKQLLKKLRQLAHMRKKKTFDKGIRIIHGTIEAVLISEPNGDKFAENGSCNL